MDRPRGAFIQRDKKKERTARFIECIGIDEFKNNVLEVIV